MQLEFVAMEGVGRFRERVELGPFDAGLNILAQPNEWGKTTVLRGLARALFDKYSSQAKEIEAMRPTGSTLAPRIELVFRADGERYRVSKRFLDGRSCELFRASGGGWERIAESDQADARLRKIIGAPAMEGRGAKPESWGLLRYLWAGQDEPADWPDWEGATGEAARGRLVTVELDATVRAVAEALRMRAGAIFTDTGRVKKDGALAVAEAELERLQGELATIKARGATLEDLRARHERCGREVASLALERESSRTAAARAREEAASVEKLVAELDRHAADFLRAEETISKVREDESALASVDEAIAAAGIERERQMAARDARAIELPKCAVALEKIEAHAQRLGKDRRERAARSERVRGLLRLRTWEEKAVGLESRRAHAHSAESELRRLEQERSRLPAVTKSMVTRARELDRVALDAGAKLEGLGLRVALMPDGAGEVVATVDGEERRIAGAAELQANRSLTLNLAGWGRIEVVSGSVEAATLAREKQRTETELKAVLSESGLGSLAEAEGQLIRVEQIAQEISAAAKALWARLDPFADLAACDAAAAQAAAELERHRATLAPSAEESAFSLAELEGEEQRITASVREDEQAEERLATESKAARAALESVRRAHDEAEREVTRLDERTKQLLVRKAELAARHVEGLAAAKAAAQSMFVAAEARRDEARRKLPDGHEKLHLRSVRAGDAVAEIEKSYEGKAGELERLRGALEAAGGEGIYSRASEIEERIEVVRAEVVRQRADGWAARLAAELIQRRQASAIQRVLAPLEEKLSAAFAELTGVADRRVFFNEELGIEGVGRHRAEVVPFAALSRGAREQLLLALRAAIALTFSPDDPPCLILDDVLVNTDPLRIENVLDFLQRLSAQVQIVILTCHAERYRGVGRLLSTTEG